MKRGLTYSAIVGGAVASVVITVGTAGTGTITAGTAIIMLVETAGAAIELGAQINIDNKSDKFFVDSANCNLESCAKDLVNKYLIELARIGRGLTDIEADAIDKEMARLIGLIPTNSDWWIDYLRNDDGTSLLEKANDGGWTPAQIWRAIGIGMQFFGVASSITGWILKKTGYLEKTLDRTSKILLNSARTAEKNIVKVDELDDISKEWYKLWQEYAPKNQTFDQYIEKVNVYDYVKKLSYGKAFSVNDKVMDGIILGLDTVVYVNGKILEKPEDLAEAREYIKMCSNNTALVVTGFTLINKKTNEIINDYCESSVSLRKIDNDDIDYYIENEPNILYSSGFIIETIMSNFINKIEGSFYNILGVPVETIYNHIYKMGYKLKDLEK